MSTAQERLRRRAAVREAAAAYEAVLGRRELYRLGVTRWQLRAELDAGRWTRLGRQAVLVGPGDVERQRWRVALLEVGAGAALDGITALQAGGLTGLQDRLVHVAVPKSSRPRRAPGVRVHETRRFRREDVLPGPLPRVRTPVAALHAALWASTDRQAALLLVAPVQQRLCSAEQVLEALELVRRHPRRRLLGAVLLDVARGAQSLGELDLTRLLRRQGLPEPDRQVVQRHPGGRVYLDARWDRYAVVVEVDGAQHLGAGAVLADALRDNELRLGGDLVLRVPALALRTDPEPFLRQLERALRAAGWAHAA